MAAVVVIVVVVVVVVVAGTAAAARHGQGGGSSVPGCLVLWYAILLLPNPPPPPRTARRAHLVRNAQRWRRTLRRVPDVGGWGHLQEQNGSRCGRPGEARRTGRRSRARRARSALENGSAPERGGGTWLSPPEPCERTARRSTHGQRPPPPLFPPPSRSPRVEGVHWGRRRGAARASQYLPSRRHIARRPSAQSAARAAAAAAAAAPAPCRPEPHSKHSSVTPRAAPAGPGRLEVSGEALGPVAAQNESRHDSPVESPLSVMAEPEGLPAAKLLNSVRGDAPSTDGWEEPPPLMWLATPPLTSSTQTKLTPEPSAFLDTRAICP